MQRIGPTQLQNCITKTCDRTAGLIPRTKKSVPRHVRDALLSNFQLHYWLTYFRFCSSRTQNSPNIFMNSQQTSSIIPEAVFALLGALQHFRNSSCHICVFCFDHISPNAAQTAHSIKAFFQCFSRPLHFYTQQNFKFSFICCPYKENIPLNTSWSTHSNSDSSYLVPLFQHEYKLLLRIKNIPQLHPH